MTSVNAAMRTNGRVKFFNEAKGFGFILRDDGSGDVFVHRTDLPGDVNFLYEGQTVTFDIDRTSRGLRAVNIVVVKSE
jgi:CspA family cold shock protein